MKRLSRSDYIYTLIFIFMLVCVVGAFFYGLKLGKENTELKYEAILNKQDETPLELTAYHQQYLVSFYHTIYLPYRDYQKKWFEHMNSIEMRSNTVDPQSIFKELTKLSDTQYKKISNKNMPSTSPLLVEAHKDVLRSLKLFSEALKQMNTNNSQGLELINEIENNVYFQEAKQYALSAKHNYYASILKWNESIDPSLQDSEILLDSNLTFQQWNQLNLNQKNNYISYLLMKGTHFTSFYTQDMTIRIDELIQNGQANKMQLTTVKDLVNTLIITGAVRTEDFVTNKNRFYQEDTLPQLPFFFEQK